MAQAAAETAELAQSTVAPAGEGVGLSVRGSAGVGGELAAAFAHCREVTRERARNFYYGLRLTPEPRRSAIYSVYAWMRAADDAVDEPGPIELRRERLEAFGAWTGRVLDHAAGRSRVDDSELGPVGIALAATVGAYPVDPVIFDDMIEGMRRDLDGGSFAHDAELSRYCYCVAGTAGLACVRIWGLRVGESATADDHARARELALRRGQAFQRTNILRDFVEDYDGCDGPSRVYIPLDALDRHGVSAEDVRRWADGPRCEALVRELTEVARGHYAASGELESVVDPACAPTLWAMTRIYSGLLEQIEADPRRLVSGRVRLAPAHKATIAIRAAIGARMRRW